MRLLRTALSLALLALPVAARAGGYASAQAAVPLQAPCAAAALNGCSYGAAAALAAPVVYAPAVQAQVVVPQAVYVQPQAAVVVRQQAAYVPVAQQAIVSPYVVQAQANVVAAQAQVGYGAGAALAPRRGVFRQRAQRQQPVVAKSVVRQGRPGLVGRIFGR